MEFPYKIEIKATTTYIYSEKIKEGLASKTTTGKRISHKISKIRSQL
jgi:hypothetical protein